MSIDVWGAAMTPADLSAPDAAEPSGATESADNGPSAGKAPSPAADRTLIVLETLIGAGEPLILTELAKRTGIPLATCASIAQTLERRGYAVRRVVGRSHYWRPTLRLYSLAAQMVRSLDLAAVAQPHLRTLADELNMPAHVGVLDGHRVTYVAKAAPSGRFVQFDTYPGKVAPFNLTALGKAIAAFLPPAELAPLLEHISPGSGPKARAAGPGGAAPRELLDELARARVDGYATEDEEEEADIACVAAPIFDAEGAVAGSVGVTGFSSELMTGRLSFALEAVRRSGEAISGKLGYHRP